MNQDLFDMDKVGAFAAANDATRERLRRLAERVSDADLARPLEEGWTVAAILVHMAFWDGCAAALAEGVARTGRAERCEVDADTVNVATLQLAQVIPDRAAPALAVRAAERADAAMAALDAAALAAIAAVEWPISPGRSWHRGEHLDQIEQALGWQGEG